MSNIEELVYRAKLAEQAERYEEMVYYMKTVCTTKPTALSQEERNLLSVSYKNVVGARRESWSKVYTLEAKEKTKMESVKDAGDKDNAKRHELQANLCREYRVKIENELTSICHEVLDVLSNHLIKVENPDVAAIIPDLITKVPTTKDEAVDSQEQHIKKILKDAEEKTECFAKLTNGESIVFYFKMIGDYHRYLAEFNVERELERVQASSRSLSGYYIASHIAQTHLSPSHPIRLGLALNFSVFYYEIMSQPDRACELAKAAFDEAICEIDTKESDNEKDSALIMQLLRDNLVLWTSDMNEEDEDDAIGEEP